MLRWYIILGVLIAVMEKTANGLDLTMIGSKPQYYTRRGQASNPPIVFIHGLGAYSEYWTPLIAKLSLEQSHSVHLYDLEGHGQSPTFPGSKVSIASYVSDLAGIFSHAKINANSGATIIAHSMGGLIAIQFALAHPSLVRNLILLGPAPAPVPEAAAASLHLRAAEVRRQGMTTTFEKVAAGGTSAATKANNPLATAQLRRLVLKQGPDGYAKGLVALASVTEKQPIERLQARTMIITGEEDRPSKPEMCIGMCKAIPKCEKVVVLKQVGHWHVYEDVAGVSAAINEFLRS